MTVPEPVLPPVAPVDATAQPTGRSHDELLVLVTDVLMQEKLTEEEIYAVLAQYQYAVLGDLIDATPETIGHVYSAIEQASAK
jgi:hypothetical protein